ncbi:GTPase Era [Candidatus Desulfovibrio trichonymphae]|uniref:GTPase Era n=1 Tax=Candidatus Desulfovibrio trichonymphae TaxID=1725232 RepID=A0A1J1DR59_9BACT|nr:GTPase Era [Candidatus Desulfovibrio trichonymphae]BAV92345.1 GTPase Era [Candidatus Desulfovibrio trichonymphae]GHU90748.1 GTPase Era [Deltaproteobacteria bacterium]GHU98016.1 GTPase Era [Deltaproteobacteria bacterium]
MTQTVYRCGHVAIMGPPNAGKSTLLNAFLGKKVTIVTPRAQTTRNQIMGILTNPAAQIIFMDTPGLTQMRGRLSKTMIQAVWQSLGQADVIMPVLDAHLYICRPEFLERDLAPAADALAGDNRPIIAVANKIDMFGNKSRMLPLLTRLQEIWPAAEIFPASALCKDGLQGLVCLVESRLPEGEAQYPADQLSISPLRFMAAEIIREKLFMRLREEVPYGVAVEVENWEENEEQGRTIIHAVIYVARPMYKAMVIGRGGGGIKEIGSEARREMIELIGGKVHLELWVKVRENWAEDPIFLHNMGFA